MYFTSKQPDMLILSGLHQQFWFSDGPLQFILWILAAFLNLFVYLFTVFLPDKHIVQCVGEKIRKVEDKERRVRHKTYCKWAMSESRLLEIWKTNPAMSKCQNVQTKTFKAVRKTWRTLDQDYFKQIQKGFTPN